MTGIIRRMAVVLMSASFVAMAADGKQVTFNPSTGVRTLKLQALRSLKISIAALEKSNFERTQTFGDHFELAQAAYHTAENALNGNPADYDAVQKALDAAQRELKWIEDNEKLRGKFLQAQRALADRIQDVCEQLHVTLADETLQTVTASHKQAVASYNQGAFDEALKTIGSCNGVLDERIAGETKTIMDEVTAAMDAGRLFDAKNELTRVLCLSPGNTEAQKLMQDVRSKTVTTLKVIALMNGQEVPAQIHINGEWEDVPYIVDVKKGDKVAVTASYASGMAVYGVGQTDIVCDWVGEKAVNVELKAVNGPSFRQNWNVALPGTEMAMCFVRPGTFMMGRKYGEQSGETLHEVELRTGFWLGKTEVTQKQWMAVMGNNPSFDKTSDSNPVENVSWDDAMLFCRKLTQREKLAGRLPEGFVYTLPTEAQWEYACRAGNDGAYAFGDDELVLALYGNVVGTEDGFAGVAPVCSRRHNAWGFYDMHGNVSEWCRDLYGTYPETRMIDPCGPEEAEPLRIHRGGNWNHSAASARSCTRDFATPSFHDECLGFRVALAVDKK